MSGKRWVLFLLAAAAALTCSCASKHALLKTRGHVVVKPQFNDIPVPEKFELLKEKSYHFEYAWKNVRHARLFYRGDTSVEEVMRYYSENMPTTNWGDGGTSGGDKIEMDFYKTSDSNKERCTVYIYTVENKTIVEIHLDPIR